MKKVQKKTIDEIKQHVMQIEGFELAIEGGPRKLIDVSLRPSRKTSGDTTVSEWIQKNFPNAAKNKVAVLRSSGKEAKLLTLEKVRASYPKDFRKIVRTKKNAEKKEKEAKLALKTSQRKASQAQREVIKAVSEVNAARKNGQIEAGGDALERALRNPDRYHEHVVELCKNAINNCSGGTQTLMEFLLAAWTRTEKECERLTQLLAESKTSAKGQ